MSDVKTGVGSQVFVGDGSSSAVDQTTFEAVTWVKIGEVTEIPEFGEEKNAVEYASMDDGRTRTLKGRARGSTITLTMGHVAGDPGQQALQTAYDAAGDVEFKATLNDPGSGLTPTPTTYYFWGAVMAININPGDGNNPVMMSATIAINTKPLKVLPA